MEPSDLVALARLVEAGTEPPATMARAMARLPKLLGPATVGRMREMAFLETTSGALAPPNRAYERTERLVAALGEDAPFAAATPPKVLRQLEGPTLPPVDEVLAAMRRRREQDEPLARPNPPTACSSKPAAPNDDARTSRRANRSCGPGPRGKRRSTA